MSTAKSVVLVIDDQPGIRRLLVEVLSDEGYIVITAGNGYEGLQTVREYKPDLILMDMKMPGMDGIETLRELKKIDQEDRVIMMTAYGELEMVNQAQEIGASGYITKPFDINTLCQLISQCLDNQKKALKIS